MRALQNGNMDQLSSWWVVMFRLCQPEQVVEIGVKYGASEASLSHLKILILNGIAIFCCIVAREIAKECRRISMWFLFRSAA
jgi:hypothetical protein